MKKLLSFSIFIILSVVKSDDVFKEAILDWKFGPHDPAKVDIITSRRFYADQMIYVKGSVPVIYENAFKNYENLFRLTLDNTNLQEIQAGAFRSVPKLSIIECQYNKLSEIKSNVFVDLTLSDLQLRNNRIKVLEKRAFKNSTISNRFSLEGNEIEEVEKDVFDNIHVKAINLANNSISKLERGIFDKVFPNNISVGFELLLQINKLEKIDPEVFNNNHISGLILDNNQISELRPGDFKNMPNLKALSLSGNKLTEIGENIFSNLHLREILLSNNQISKIATATFDGMDSISYFFITNNQLKTFDPNWFHNALVNNSRLYFGDNFIEEISSEAFKNYQNARILDLRRNKIRKVASDAFKNTKIHYLLLGDNSIEKLDENSFAGKDLKIFGLDLTKNKLKCFEGDLDNIFVSVKNVWLDENPIDATCIEKIKKYQKTIIEEVPGASVW